MHKTYFTCPSGIQPIENDWKKIGEKEKKIDAALGDADWSSKFSAKI